jgi:hypothetical protein
MPFGERCTVGGPTAVASHLPRDGRRRPLKRSGDLGERLVSLDPGPNLPTVFRAKRLAWHAGTSTGRCLGVTRPSWPDRCNGRRNSPILSTRRAGGVTTISGRQFRAELRWIEIICFLADSGVSLLVRGTQRALARRFGVSEATISRDLEGILAERGPSRCCPFCGAKPLDDEGVRAIEEGHDRFRRWLGPSNVAEEDGGDEP